MLEEGLLPTAAVAPILRRHLEAGGETHGNLPRVLARWEKEQEWASFQSVDFTMCKAGIIYWWRSIQDLYNAVALQRPGGCAREGCSGAVVERPHKHGGLAKKYCSTRCRESASKARRRAAA